MVMILKKTIRLLVYVLISLFLLLYVTQALTTKLQVSQVSDQYLMFDSAQQKEYDRIKHILSETEIHKNCYIDKKYSLDFYDEVFSILVNEDPDMFWLMGLQYRVDVQDKLVVQFTTTINKEERAAIKTFVENEIDTLMQTTLDLSDMSAFLTYYQYIYENIDYVVTDNLATSAYGCLYTKKGNCQGYAKLLRYLCIEKGIPCTLVVGTYDGTPHMWNCVYLEGVSYYVDVTMFSKYGTILFSELPSSYNLM